MHLVSQKPSICSSISPTPSPRWSQSNFQKHHADHLWLPCARFPARRPGSNRGQALTRHPSPRAPGPGCIPTGAAPALPPAGTLQLQLRTWGSFSREARLKAYHLLRDMPHVPVHQALCLSLSLRPTVSSDITSHHHVPCACVYASVCGIVHTSPPSGGETQGRCSLHTVSHQGLQNE